MSEKRTITATEFRDAMRQAVVLKGEDFRYRDTSEHCTYTEPDPNGFKYLMPSCIVGYALRNLGVKLGALYDNEGRTAYSVIPDFFNVSDDVRDAATAAQSAQDSGDTWGQALAAYDRHFQPELVAA